MNGTFMRLRYLSLFVVLTACASTPARDIAPQNSAMQAPVTPPAVQPVPQAQSSAAAASSQAAPAAATAQPAAGVQPITYATFEQWEANFHEKARAHGFSDDLVDSMLAGVQPLATVTTSDSQQPE